MLVFIEKTHPDFSTFFDVFIEAGMKEPFQEILKNSLKEIEQQPENFGVNESFDIDYKEMIIRNVYYTLIEKTSGFSIEYDNFLFLEVENIWLIFKTYDDEHQINFDGLDVGIKLLIENKVITNANLRTTTLNDFHVPYRENCNKINNFKSLEKTKYTTFGISILDAIDI
jgi:hypothetical protein